MIEIYERLRPGEPPTAENARALLYSRFFDPKRYDLANVGRYKINKKLHIQNRLFNQRIAQTLVDPETGEVLVEDGTVLDRRTLDRILPYLEDDLETFTLKTVDGVLDEDVKLQSIKIYAPSDVGEVDKVLHVIGNANIGGEIKHVTPADIIASISYFFNLLHGVGRTDDIDHLGNRRLRSV